MLRLLDELPDALVIATAVLAVSTVIAIAALLCVGTTFALVISGATAAVLAYAAFSA